MEKTKINAKDYINQLRLEPHPEGGYYRRIFESDIHLENRRVGTAIHYLLSGNDFSAWHRIKSDELWFYHKGSTVIIYAINQHAKLHIYYLGDPALNPKAQLQITIPANSWFAAELADKDNFALVSCAVTPGFDFAEFELAVRDKLIVEYPEHAEIIERLTR